MSEKDLKLLRRITKNFKEVSPILGEHKKAQTTFRKWERKLTTIDKKYSFLLDVIGIEVGDNELCNAVKKLFKKAGFEKVNHFKSKRQKRKREDLQLYYKNELFIVEVKGLSTRNPSKADLMQVFPYIAENKNRQPTKNVFGFSVINHDYKNYVEDRPPRFKDDEKEQDAKNCGYGFISALDLVLGFIKLKEEKISFDEFKNKLQQTGIIIYG